MSQPDNAKPANGPIKNASEIIERFGGIRPLAKKIDVAVTTVQGWKKRDVIPAARRSVILEAAKTYNIDLSDIMPDAPPANENAPKEAHAADTVKSPPTEKNEVKTKIAEPTEKEPEPAPDNIAPEPETPENFESLESRLTAAEKTTVNKNTVIVLLLIAAILSVVAIVLWTEKSKNEKLDRLSALEARTQEIEGQVAGVKEKQSFFGTLIPEDLDQQLTKLQEQAGQTKEQIGHAVEKAKEVSADVLAQDAGTISQRAQKLEAHLQEMNGGSPVLAGMLEKIQGISAQPGGSAQMDAAMNRLSAIMDTLQDLPANNHPSEFADTLDTARNENETLGQTFEGVPATDLKAAAMLLAMTQFRSSLNRDNEAFADDLNVLMGLVDKENVELRSALERLAPHAEEGVLTPGGLKNEFKTLAGDSVIASLSGEDVSISERAQARFNEVFQVEKNGELITGTKTQITVDEAGKQLENDNIEGAIAALQTLDGPAAAQMAGWIDKAQVTLLAQKLKAMMGQSINMTAYGTDATAGPLLPEDSAALLPGGMPGSSQIIRNEETGINILHKKALPGIKNMPKDANPFE
ncbi:MAG: hypothetical protein R3E13_06500 [Alphaproteobacteria bacterium]